MSDDIVNSLHEDISGITVFPVLCQKHSSAQPPRAPSLVPCNVLMQLKDVEITRSHLLFATHHIQGCKTG